MLDKNKSALFKKELVSLFAKQLSQTTTSPQKTLLFSTLLLIVVIALSLSLSRSSTEKGSVGTSIAQQNALELQQLRDESPTNYTEQTIQQSTLSQSFIEEYDRLATKEITPTLDSQVNSQTEPTSLISIISLGLLIVVVVIYVIRWLGNNYLNNYRQQESGHLSESLIVRFSKELEPGQKLQLIEFGDEFLLLGVTPQAISLLTKYSHDGLPHTLSARLQTTDKISDRSHASTDTSFMATEQASLTALLQSLEQLRQLQHGNTSQT